MFQKRIIPKATYDKIKDQTNAKQGRLLSFPPAFAHLNLLPREIDAVPREG